MSDLRRKQARFGRLVTSAVLLTLAFAAPALSQNVNRTLPFEVDKWVELEINDGAVTLHRFRIVRDNSLVSPKLLGNKPDFEYHDGLQFQLEFTNEGDYTWKAGVQMQWKDDRDALIEGMAGTLKLDKRKRHHVRVLTDTALRYGIKRAQNLELVIEIDPN